MPKRKASDYICAGAIRLEDSVVGSWAIECHFCGTTHTFTFDESGEDKRTAAGVIHQMGWRERSSRKYQVIAAACPDCAKLKEKDL